MDTEKRSHNKSIFVCDTKKDESSVESKRGRENKYFHWKNNILKQKRSPFGRHFHQ